MPAVIHSVRDTSAIGRFPTVTFPFVEDVEAENEEPEEDDASNESACRRWLRKACPCCYKRPGDDDVTETVVTGVDDPDKEEDANGEKPTTGEGNLNELLLQVQSIDLMNSKKGENLMEHHTNLYQSDKFIIRRGQTFQMWINLSRPFDPQTDELHLDLKTGSKMPLTPTMQRESGGEFTKMHVDKPQGFWEKVSQELNPTEQILGKI